LLSADNVEEGSEIKYTNYNPQSDVMKLLSFCKPIHWQL